MARDPPVGEVKGQRRGKKADQKEKDSQVSVLSDQVEELVRIRQGSTILPFVERLAQGAWTSPLGQTNTSSNCWVMFLVNRAWKRNVGCCFVLWDLHAEGRREKAGEHVRRVVDTEVHAAQADVEYEGDAGHDHRPAPEPFEAPGEEQD